MYVCMYVCMYAPSTAGRAFVNAGTWRELFLRNKFDIVFICTSPLLPTELRLLFIIIALFCVYYCCLFFGCCSGTSLLTSNFYFILFESLRFTPSNKRIVLRNYKMHHLFHLSSDSNSFFSLNSYELCKKLGPMMAAKRYRHLLQVCN